MVLECSCFMAQGGTIRRQLENPTVKLEVHKENGM